MGNYRAFFFDMSGFVTLFMTFPYLLIQKVKERFHEGLLVISVIAIYRLVSGIPPIHRAKLVVHLFFGPYNAYTYDGANFFNQSSFYGTYIFSLVIPYTSNG